MSQAQAHSLDAWSYYQAKSTKQSIAENALDLLKFEDKPGSDALIAKYQEKIARYDTEKAAIQAKAEGFEKEYDAINVFDDQFDMTDALLSIAIAMFGITALTRKTWLFYSTSPSAGFAAGQGFTLGTFFTVGAVPHSNSLS